MGIEWIPYHRLKSGFSSELILTNFTLPLDALITLLSTGRSTRHALLQGAQNTTSTGCLEDSTSDSKLAFPTSSRRPSFPFVFILSTRIRFTWHLRHRLCQVLVASISH